MTNIITALVSFGLGTWFGFVVAAVLGGDRE